MLSKTTIEPAALDFIPLHESKIEGNAWAYVKECLDTGWVSSVGQFVYRFEERFVATVGSGSAVAVINGTSALHIALQVVGVESGDEVIVSSLTFVAPVNAILYCGASPVFMDADPLTWQMDVAKLEAFLASECEIRADGCFNKKTKRRLRAILPVHILGYACDMDLLLPLAKKYRLRVVEDAAESIGVRYKGKHVGTYGDAAGFSFNGNKLLTTGGGGMVLTHKKKDADTARYLTTQAKDDELEYIHNHVGYNYRLTNMQAALGVAQLENLPKFLLRKKETAARYRRAFLKDPALQMIAPVEGTEPTDWLNTILLPDSFKLADRKAFVLRMIEQKIGVRPLWHPIPSLPPYRSFQAFEIKNADRIYERAVSLPSSVGLTDGEIDRVIETVRSLLR